MREGLSRGTENPTHIRAGGVFEAELLEEEAPETCKAFLNALPMEGTVRQARFAGEEVFFRAEIAVGPENRVAPKAGDIAFNADPAWKAVCIYYGDKIKASSPPYNLFARIRGDLAQLKAVGERVWRKGEETVRVEKGIAG